MILVTKDHGLGPVYPSDVEMGLIRIESHTKVSCDSGDQGSWCRTCLS